MSWKSLWLTDLVKLFDKVFKLVKREVTEEHLDKAVEVVTQAKILFVDNAARREWAVSQLMSKFGIPESLARLIVELAVRFVKSREQAS